MKNSENSIELEVGKRYGDFIITNIHKYDDESKKDDKYYPYGITSIYYRLHYSDGICVCTEYTFRMFFAKIFPIPESVMEQERICIEKKYKV